MSQSRPPRRASDAMERWIPRVLVALVVLAVVLILVALAVLLGLWPGERPLDSIGWPAPFLL